MNRDALDELAPLLRRVAGLDPRALVRLVAADGTVSALARLPFGVLVARTVPVDGDWDVTVAAAAAVGWLDEGGDAPQRRDGEWRGSRPPTVGWRRIESVPDEVVRGLVRKGALALKDAAAREGVPGAQPRAEVADALLDSVVLTVTDDDGASADVTLRALSALTRMGFLPRGGQTHFDTAGRWVRVVAEYGTVYLERPGGLGGLALR